MKKHLLLLPALAMVSLVACSGQTSNTSSNTSAPTSSEAEVSSVVSSVAGSLTREEWTNKIAEADKTSDYAENKSVHIKGNYKTKSSLNFEVALDRDFALKITDHAIEDVFFNDAEQAIYNTYDSSSQDNSKEATDLFHIWYAAHYELTHRGYLSETVAKTLTDYEDGNPLFVYDTTTKHFSFSAIFDAESNYLKCEWDENLLLVKADIVNHVSEYSLTYTWSKDKLPDTTYPA